METTISGTLTSTSYSIDEVELIRKTVLENGGSGPVSVGMNLAFLMAEFNDVDFNSAEGRACASLIVQQILKANDPFPDPSSIGSITFTPIISADNPQPI